MSKCQTGDLILFHGCHSIISWMVEGFTGSQWSHVGIVLRSPTYIDEKLTGLYLWESGSEQDPDCEDHVRKYGVQITDLKKKINEYEGIVVWRRLHWDPNELETKLTIIHNTVHNKLYDLDLVDFIYAKLGIPCRPNRHKNGIWSWFRYNPRKVDKMMCSALVAYVYTELGLLPSDTHWTDIFPKYFSEEHRHLQLIDAHLGQERCLKR